jgi:hypothetical protein
MSARYDRDQVRDELRPEEVLIEYGWPVRRQPSGDFRSKECPECGPDQTELFLIGRRSVHCFRCGAHGDLLTLVAFFEHLHPQRDFPRVLEIAATIAGVNPRGSRHSSAEQRRRERERADRRARQELQQREARRVQRAEAITKATLVWDALAHAKRGSAHFVATLAPNGSLRKFEGSAGERYLWTRHLESLVNRRDILRLDSRGVHVPLYEVDGQIVNVICRRYPWLIDPEEPRMLSLLSCPTDGTFGHPRTLSETTGPVFLVEGIFDYLSALVAWPGRAVFGAHSAGRLPYVAELIARSIRGTNRDLELVPHNDIPGRRFARRAKTAAIGAGLPRERIRARDTGAGDLNDWLCQRVRGSPLRGRCG